MEVNETIVLAYFIGGFAVLVSTIMRYLLSTLPNGKLRRNSNKLLASIAVVDFRENISDVKLMLYQHTGAVWLLSGTAYGMILKKLIIRGVVESLFEFLVLVGPGILSMLVIRILERKYWK